MTMTKILKTENHNSKEQSQSHVGNYWNTCTHNLTLSQKLELHPEQSCLCAEATSGCEKNFSQAQSLDNQGSR